MNIRSKKTKGIKKSSACTSRTVRFDLRRTEVHECAHNGGKTWLSDDEMEQFQISAHQYVELSRQKSQQSKGLEDEQDTTRGLEFYIDPSICHAKTLGFQRFVATLLGQQKTLRNSNCPNQDQILANISERMSRSDRQEALVYGARDAWQSRSLEGCFHKIPQESLPEELPRLSSSKAA